MYLEDLFFFFDAKPNIRSIENPRPFPVGGRYAELFELQAAGYR